MKRRGKGGGPGSNQYGARGVSQAACTQAAAANAVRFANPPTRTGVADRELTDDELDELTEEARRHGIEFGTWYANDYAGQAAIFLSEQRGLSFEQAERIAASIDFDD